MKITPRTLALLPFSLGLLAPGASAAPAAPAEAKPAPQTMTQLAFGPEGVLFVADPRGAAIFAFDTGDAKPAAPAASASSPVLLKVEGINQKAAALLGTTPDQITIEDLAVNPASRNVYLTVTRGLGPDAAPVLLRVKSGGELEIVSIDKMKFTRVELPNPANDAPARGNRSPRLEAITDIAYFDGRVLVAGLSNEEFASTLRAIPYPFTTADKGTSVEIYHGAHGAFETRAPVRTFTTYNVGGQPQLFAAYTCTPLVQFPLADLKPGAKIQGKTIGEFGNRNRPLDMIVYRKDGKDFLLLTNQSRGVMKVATDQITASTPSITSRVNDTAGVAFEPVNWTGVVQMDRLDDNNVVVVRTADGSQVLESLALP